jgi:enediyne biosynthesis protein E4
MTRFRLYLCAGLLISLAGVLLSTELNAAGPAFVFRDTAQETGLLPEVAGIRGHSAGWGDADGDGWIDLYVGTFSESGSKPNMFFRNSNGKFRLDDQEALRIPARANSALFVDLDNDGDLDLYVSSMPKSRDGQALKPCTLFRNEGGGRFRDVSAGNGACPPAFGGRSAAALDFDGDGLLDLLVGEDPLPGYNGSPTKSSRLFRNQGSLQFADVSRETGMPADIPGLGVAAADVNNDGWPDFFLAANNGGNRLFLNERGPSGRKFREPPGSPDVFAWKDSGGDDMVCGVCFADVNRDGLLDVAIGPHYQRPWLTPVPVRLYLNRGIKDGNLRFEDISEAAGLKPLPMKTPHVEIQDFDNDGWADVSTSIVKFANGRPHPVIFKGLGVTGGLPRFREDALGVNDFPTEADRAINRSGSFFDKMIQEKKILYTAPGPSGDYDNDGRLDLFLASWWLEAPSLLLHNETPGGHWLNVRVEGGAGVNRMGIGTRVQVYRAGKANDSSSLLGCRDISTGYGYTSGQPAVAHFGLGTETACDIVATLPHGKGEIVRKGVKADQTLVLSR